MRRFSNILYLMALCGCFFSSCTVRSKAYYDYYSHLRRPQPPSPLMQETQYFLIILVDACHLDYFQPKDFFQSVAKHPSTGSKCGSVGHAWIYLQGPQFFIEGGHSGEGNSLQPYYFDGVMDGCDRQVPNPISYLWKPRFDGFFQKGCGGHKPTCAAKITLNKEQFEEILRFIHPSSYFYPYYALTQNQCTSFAAACAAIAGLYVKTQITVAIPSKINFRHAHMPLWKNPAFSSITFASPDALEKSLIQAMQQGKAENALHWYLKHKN